jgi:hypothetical protein
VQLAVDDEGNRLGLVLVVKRNLYQNINKKKFKLLKLRAFLFGPRTVKYNTCDIK